MRLPLCAACCAGRLRATAPATVLCCCCASHCAVLLLLPQVWEAHASVLSVAEPKAEMWLQDEKVAQQAKQAQARGPRLCLAGWGWGRILCVHCARALARIVCVPRA